MEPPTDEERLWPQQPPSPIQSLGLVGNGFDLALGYASKYSDFRDFLRKNQRRYLQHGAGEVADIWAQVNRVAGENWCDFEARLGELDLPSTVAEMDYVDDGELSELDGLAADGDDYARDFANDLKAAFADWVSGLKPVGHQPNKQASHLARTSDAIVTFNYTDSLQQVFKVPATKILHIHGTARGPSRPYFGCPESNLRSRTGGSNGLSGAVRAQALADMVDELTKTPRTDLLDRFLAHYQGLRVISSYGLSFGEADHPYVRHLIQQYCTGDTVWINYARHTEAAEHFTELMTGFNFPGIAASSQV